MTRRSALMALSGLTALALLPGCKRKSAKDWVLKGIAFHNQGKINEAEHCFDQALKIDSKFGPAWTGMGHVFYSRGQITEALECVKKATYYYPGEADAWFLEGKLLTELQQFDQAVDSFDRVLALNPNDKKAREYKCIILLKQKREIAYVRQCLQEPPEKAEDVSEQEKKDRALFEQSVQIWESTRRTQELRERMRDAGAIF
jgi:tetratricopeptide (TPR) repeat protein